VLTATDSAGTVTTTYDLLNRESTVTDPFGQTLVYSYDADNNVVEEQDSQGGTTTSVYDIFNELTSRTFVSAGATLREDLAYNADGNTTTLTRYSDAAGMQQVGQTVWTYDAAQRVSGITATGVGGVVETSFGYNYDANDWLTSQTVTTGSGSPVTTDYEYDGSGEVTQAGNEHFSYDLGANQTTSPSGTDTIGADNELMSDGTNTYQYDAVGNLVTMTNLSTGDVWTYSCDLDNRLVKVVEQSSAGTTLMTASYGFDALGDRITKSVWTAATGTVTTNFGFDNGQVWDDLSSTGTVENRYVLGDGPDNVLAQVTNGTTVYWLVTDRLGSVVMAVNGAGTSVVEAMSYDAFGNETTTGTVVTNRGYTGAMTDAETGMQYHSLGDGQQAGRVYDPTTGTFTTRDPDGFGGGQSDLYAYAGNDPANATDPTGLAVGWYNRAWEALGGGWELGLYGAWSTGLGKLRENASKFSEEEYLTFRHYDLANII
jgi:RHS repeat-associated protein